MTPMFLIGIDPGASGAAAVLNPAGEICALLPWAKMTPAEMHAEILMFRGAVAYMEKVHSMPKQGVASTFKFGWNAGWWEGMLTGACIPLIETPIPATWQRAMGCLSKGDKNVTKAKAQQLWPRQVKQLTHATADAALIAEYGRRRAVALGATGIAPDAATGLPVLPVIVAQEEASGGVQA